MTVQTAGVAGPGHNLCDLGLDIEVRAFNSLHGYIPGGRQRLQVPAGCTVGELAERFSIPPERIWLVLVNGRDISRGLVGAPVRATRVLEHGDVVAFSGPVPYSYGMGSPVV